jgi:broad specificity phosphatase PhoE
MKLYLVRHGESIANKKGFEAGQKHDVSLSEKGFLQAKQTANYLKNKKIDIIYSSDLLRAKQTAKEIGKILKSKNKVSKKIAELDKGRYLKKSHGECMNYINRRAEKLGIEKSDVKLPGGESYNDCKGRVFSFLNKLKEDNKNAIIVAHSGVIRLILRELSEGKLKEQKPNNASVSEVSFICGKWKFGKVNYVGYLRKIKNVIYISGLPGSGKSTLIKKFEENGYKVYPELMKKFPIKRLPNPRSFETAKYIFEENVKRDKLIRKEKGLVVVDRHPVECLIIAKGLLRTKKEFLKIKKMYESYDFLDGRIVRLIINSKKSKNRYKSKKIEVVKDDMINDIYLAFEDYDKYLKANFKIRSRLASEKMFIKIKDELKL